jgi:hypothetical protein
MSCFTCDVWGYWLCGSVVSMPLLLLRGMLVRFPCRIACNVFLPGNITTGPIPGHSRPFHQNIPPLICPKGGLELELAWNEAGMGVEYSTKSVWDLGHWENGLYSGWIPWTFHGIQWNLVDSMRNSRLSVKTSIDRVVEQLAGHFKCRNLGPTEFLLGVGITRDHKLRAIALHQRQFILDILERYNMTNCSPVSTPMIPGCVLTKEMGASTPDDIKFMHCQRKKVFTWVSPEFTVFGLFQ